MTSSSKRLHLPAHGAVEVASGMALMLAPAVLEFGVAGLIVSACLGAVRVGVGLTLTSPRGPFVAWHRHFDTVFAVATAFAALVLAVAGDTAAVFLAAMVAVQACVNYATSYVVAG